MAMLMGILFGVWITIGILDDRCGVKPSGFTEYFKAGPYFWGKLVVDRMKKRI